MQLGAMFWLAIGLAMDSTAVAAARGLAAEHIRPRHALLVAGLFGGFQAMMPLFGWWLGVSIGPLVQAWDHWIAFGLLAAIGSHMLWEARSSASPNGLPQSNPFGFKLMLALALATSIDAFAVGITLPMLRFPLVLSIVTIGLTTAVLSVAGLYAGRRFGASLGQRLDIVGGLFLIGLGFKILVEHLCSP